jgi:hypothetical protein
MKIPQRRGNKNNKKKEYFTDREKYKESLLMSNDSHQFYGGESNSFSPCGSAALADRPLVTINEGKYICGKYKKAPSIVKRQGPFEKSNYFLQAQPQPEDFFSSCFCMVPVSVHSGHFFGLHLPSLVAPHFSHLNTAIFFSSVRFRL